MGGRLFDPGLYLVTDRGLAGERSIEDLVRAAVRGGVSVVQLREKALETGEFVALARRLKAGLADVAVRLIINDRLDVVLASGADGIHIGQRDMAYDDARRLLGPEAIIGVSVETPEDAEEAERYDCDYLGVSPVFPTPTKTDVATFWGLEGLSRLRRRSQKVLVAIGGINSSNASDVLDAGADGIAVVSAICAARDPEAAAAELKEILEQARRRLG